MTVAAVIVPSDASDALAEASGRASVRRIVDVAWAGGAMPIIVVATDPGDAVSGVLLGSPAVLVEPSDDGIGPYRTGAAAAAATVQETTALLLWPGRMTWVDPETVTSLIEAHGARATELVRPVHDRRPGWPLLVPVTSADAVGDEDPADAGLPLIGEDVSLLELGDPGSVLGREVSLDELPGYHGPPEPVAGPPPEWGAAAAETPDPETTDPETPDPEMSDPEAPEPGATDP